MPNIKGFNPKLSIEKENEAFTSAISTAEQPKKKKWLIPVVIGGGVLVVGILTYILLKRK
jgi:hypothetical protein